MQLDKLKEPCDFYYEDYSGLKVPYHETHTLNKKWYAQHVKCVAVYHSMCLDPGKEKWQVKLLKWILRKLPNNYKETQTYSSVQWSYPIIKYLVEERKWSFNGACITCSKFCERCMNVALIEISHTSASSLSDVTWCKYCKIMDPEHDRIYKLKHIYGAYFNKYDIQAEYESLFNDEII